VREFAAVLVKRYGVAIDFAIHAPDRHGDERNYHAHLLMTTRRIGPDGFGAKTRELDDFKTGPREIEAIRQTWERIGNRALEQAGFDVRIDCRSYADQGLDREATVHLGPVASGMERSGEGTDLGDRNRAAKARNAERDRIEGDRKTLSAEIIDLAAERERRAEERELRAAIRSGSPPRILEALTERRSTFSRGDLNRELAKVIFDPKERAALTGQILALPDVVGLRETEEALVSRYTTRTVLAAEARVIADAAALAGETRFGLTAIQGEGTLDRHPQVTGERRAAFWHMTEGPGLAVLAGESGTGKSTTLAAVRDAYETAGYRVIGMAWTNQVVQNLKRDGFRDTTTIAGELYRLDSGATRWDGRTVLIVDEAGMLSTKHLAAVTGYARAAGAKLILAGDDKQFASMERGGLFGALKEQHGAAELHEVVRVSDAEQRRAFNLMHKGEFLPALAIFSRGSITWTGRQHEAFDALVGQWGRDLAAAPDKARFVFAYTNADVLELNAALRAVRKEQGALGADHMLDTADGSAAFAAGDRIQFTGTSARRDERQAGLVNGGVGTILNIEGKRVTVALDGKPGAPERLVTFVAGDDHAAGEFDRFRHGYAGTIYKGQGRTLGQTYLYHSPHWRSATSYVALTRHRENVTLFVATETARDLGQLARQMARVDDCRAASQFFAAEGGQGPAPTNLAERRASVEEAAARRRQAQTGSGEGPSAQLSEDEEELREAREAVAEASRREQRERMQERSRGRGWESADWPELLVAAQFSRTDSRANSIIVTVLTLPWRDSRSCARRGTTMPCVTRIGRPMNRRMLRPSRRNVRRTGRITVRCTKPSSRSTRSRIRQRKPRKNGPTGPFCASGRSAAGWSRSRTPPTSGSNKIAR
jgi:ATP-dependent exoDNAse (exonuclease V) alpha subunit